MGYNNRELEIKYQVEGCFSLKHMEGILDNLLGDSYDKKIIGKSKDVYWEAPKKSEADFVRVRFMPEGHGELTLKHTDKNIRDRVEIDVRVEDPDQAVALQEKLLGKPTGEITKRYLVYLLNKKGATLSVYKILSDDRTFIEVEARTQKELEDYNKVLLEKFPLKMVVINKSIFELFVK